MWNPKIDSDQNLNLDVHNGNMHVIKILRKFQFIPFSGVGVLSEKRWVPLPILNNYNVHVLLRETPKLIQTKN